MNRPSEFKVFLTGLGLPTFQLLCFLDASRRALYRTLSTMPEPSESRHCQTQKRPESAAFPGRPRKQGHRNRRYRNFSDFVQEEALQQERLRVDADTFNRGKPNAYIPEEQILMDEVEEVTPQIDAACDPGNSTSDKSTTTPHQIDTSLLADVWYEEDFPCKGTAISTDDEIDLATAAILGDTSKACPEPILLAKEEEPKPRSMVEYAFSHDSPIMLDKLYMASLTDSQEGTDVETETDPSPLSAGSGPLRGLGSFPTQQPQQSRNAPLGSSRLQNTIKTSR